MVFRLLAVALFAFALFAVAPSTARAQGVLDLGGFGDFANVERYAEVAVDPGGHATLANAMHLTYAPFAQTPLSNARAAYWVRLRYRSETTQPWVLTAGYRPRDVTFYVAGMPPQHSGGDVPYALRGVRAFNWIVFTLPPSNRTSDAYLRIVTDEPLVNLVAYSRDRFRSEYTRDVVVITALIAILCSLALSSIVLFFVMRDSLYLYYAAYIVFQIVYRANDFGVLQAYVVPNASFPYVRTEVVLDGLTLIAATLFIRRFLRSHAHSRILDRANVAIAVVGGIYALLALAGVPIRYTLVQNFSYVYVPI